MSESPSKKNKMASSLDQLKEMTVVVADTGDFESKWRTPVLPYHAEAAPHICPGTCASPGVCGQAVGVFPGDLGNA